MRFLMLLSALVTWVTRRKRPEKKPTLRWFKPAVGTTVPVRMVPSSPQVVCYRSKKDVVCHCPLCDGLRKTFMSDPTLESFQLPDRRPEQDSLWRHGWYSAENDRKLGHYFCKAADGRVVKVTNSTKSPTGGLAGWPDAVYVGELVSHTPCPPPLLMTEERARFVAAFLEHVFSGRQIVAVNCEIYNPHPAWRKRSISHSGRIGAVSVSPVGGDKWSVKFSLGGRVWVLGGLVGIHWGADEPELWSETTTTSGAVVCDTFTPQGGYLGHEDRDIWRAAKQALWTM